MTIAEFITTGIAFVAFIFSVYSLYLQQTAKGPKIELLNKDDRQLRVARPHKELPNDVQKAFPYIPDVLPGYALVKLIFGNAGDRAGMANIKAMKVVMKDNPRKPDLIKAVQSSNYVVVPAYEVVEKELLLKNLQLGEFPDQRLEVELEIEYGGYYPHTGKYWHLRAVNERLQVSIVRANEAGNTMTSEPNPFFD